MTLPALTRQHGELEPAGPWHIRCDFPGCKARFVPPLHVQAMSDIEERLHVRALAELNGWYVAIDRGVPDKARDLCPDHVRRR